LRVTATLAYIIIILACNRAKRIELETVNNLSDSFFNKLSSQQVNDYKVKLALLYDTFLQRRNFNGGILIAKNGQVVFEDYNGFSNFRTKDTITPNTPFHLASISKTFTGVAIMQLVEKHLVSLEDSVQKFYPAFPYPGITVKLLLTHRSGLANYPYFLTGDTAFKKRPASNTDLLNFMIAHKPDVYQLPDRGFHYCNTNYSLLALIVEKVSGQPFPDYMKSYIFEPLQMNNTFVFSIADTANYKPSYLANNRPVPMEPLDCIYGDKNVYSTPRDMLKWDEALYKNTVISKTSYEQATTPYSNEKPGKHNYGLGWRLLILPDQKIVYHNGWWHGNNTSFTRFVKDTATVIILGNRYNLAIYSGMKFSSAFGAITNTARQEE